MNEIAQRYQRRLHAELPLLASRYHVASLGLFGSYLRGTQRPDSDLDVLVSFSEAPSLLRLGAQFVYLSDINEMSIDRRVLFQFRKLTKDNVVWVTRIGLIFWEGAHWRTRQAGDSSGRTQYQNKNWDIHGNVDNG